MISLQLNVQNRQIHRDRKEPGVARGLRVAARHEASLWGPALCVPSEEGPCSRGRSAQSQLLVGIASSHGPLCDPLPCCTNSGAGMCAFHSVAEKTQA